MVGSITSIATAFGLTVTNLTPFLWILPSAFSIYLLATTRPKQLLLSNSLLNKPGEMRELDDILDKPELQVGLVGLSSSGKTTFRNMLANRPGTVRTTSNTYEIFQINVPSAQRKQLILIDSVGQDTELTAEVARRFRNIVVFLDHNESDTDERISKARIRDHKVFLNNLGNVIKSRGEKLPKIFLVANKCDLWERNEKSKSSMANLLKHGSTSLGLVVPGQNIISFQQHSNRESAKNITLLKEISENAW